jgi:hypothetical protein
MAQQSDGRRPIRPAELPGLLARARFDKENLSIERDKLRWKMAALGLSHRDVEYLILKRILREGK